MPTYGGSYQNACGLNYYRDRMLGKSIVKGTFSGYENVLFLPCL